MHHELLKACLPYLVAMAILFAAMHGLMRLSGGRLRLARLRDLHRCEAGGVQSLSFVLVLPVFLMIVLFIVQVALVMVGLITVNTAAFAAARSASVWIPAYVPNPMQADLTERENVLIAPISATTPDTVTFDDWLNPDGSQKEAKIFEAAALACVPISPSSRRYFVAGQDTQDERYLLSALVRLYGQLAPTNPIRLARFQRKLSYSLRHTRVTISFVDKDSAIGPTYNPPDDAIPRWVQNESEVGWQDPVTVEVEHDFALLPGAGSILARLLTRYDGRTDDVAPMIGRDRSSGVYYTTLRASATLTNEGLKSLRPNERFP